MSQNKKDASNKTKFMRLMEKNSFVLLFSFVIAIIIWCGVSMYQTTEVEREFQNIKIQLNLEGSLPENYNLSIFGEQDYYVDVLVKGKSYLVNDANLINKISATVSFVSVTSAGTYSLPVAVTVNETDVEVVNQSKANISVYFDELLEKNFKLEDEIVEIEGYSLPEGYVRENSKLSVDSVVLEGPALEINKITAVKAVAEIDKELTGTESFPTKIVYVGATDNATFDNVKVKDEEPVFLTVPISYTSSYQPTVSFTGMPKGMKESDIKYTVSPKKTKITVSTSDSQLINAKEISIGSIDFSQIDNTLNTISISTENSEYNFADETKEFTVQIDMSKMEKRWLQIPVVTDGVKLPKNAALITEIIEGIQLIGPSKSVSVIDNSEAYAVPILDDIELVKGINEVPVKIVLKTLTDSWVRGEYTVQIEVK